MYKHLKKLLYVPTAEEIAKVLQNALAGKFASVTVEVADCPNLTEKPFMLASEGISGHPTLADVGGVPYLVPLAQEGKVYNIRELAKQMDLPDAFVFGAGAGPRHYVGTNCEMMCNIKLGENEINNTHIAKLGKDNKCELFKVKDSADFCLLGNLFACDGKPGKVIKVSAKHRTSDGNLVTMMRQALADHYGDKPVGIGGVFVIKKGKAKLHIMPDYSKTPLNTDEDVNDWLGFFEMSSPLCCLSTFISCDPGLDLRVEHTHCFSDHGEGGHYHEDIEPDIVEYEGYFNVAECMHRFDPPSVTHKIGRD